MALRKSDKLIAIIGVIILIVAGVGIYIYATTEDEEDGEPAAEEIKYEVQWIEEFDVDNIQGKVGKRGSYTEPFDVGVDKPGSVITSVDVKITWEDDRTPGLLPGLIFKKGFLLKRGEDTLTADITLVGGETKTHSAQGKGNETLMFNINSAPDDFIIDDVETYDEALQMVLDEYSDMNTASFETVVTVKIGERIGLRPFVILRYILDRGNKFDLEVTYHYVYPEISSTENGEDELPPTGADFSDWTSTPYSSTCLPGML